MGPAAGAPSILCHVVARPSRSRFYAPGGPLCVPTFRLSRYTFRMSQLDQYDYTLPKERIAQQPLSCRSDARLMVIDRKSDSIEHRYVRDLPQLLAAGDAVVVNDTRVVAARLVGKRTATGGRWEGLFLESDTSGLWKVLGRTRGKIKAGESVQLVDREGRTDTTLTLIAQEEDGSWIVHPESEGEPHEILAQVGRTPLPPYIRGGEMLPEDETRYQTVYAEHPGSVAAPTAGLHFTDALLAQLAEAKIDRYQLTLHVGTGTFKPIASDSLSEHPMHSEWAHLAADTAAALTRVRTSGGRVVAVGTTSMRVLETAARTGSLAAFEGPTDLFIHPPFTFHAVDALLTNFHLPRSTLLVLVRTFGGDALIRRAYALAVEEEYRFYSYGDAMLIL